MAEQKKLMSADEALAEIARLRARAEKAEAEAAEARKAAAGRITVKVGQSGTVCVYGLGRFPVSLHPSQWDRLLTPETLAEIGKLSQLSRNNPAAFAKAQADAVARAEARKA